MMQHIESKNDNIGQTRIKSRKKQIVINTIFRKTPVKQKEKKNTLQTQ